MRSYFSSFRLKTRQKYRVKDPRDTKTLHCVLTLYIRAAHHLYYYEEIERDFEPKCQTKFHDGAHKMFVIEVSSRK